MVRERFLRLLNMAAKPLPAIAPSSTPLPKEGIEHCVVSGPKILPFSFNLLAFTSPVNNLKSN